MPEAKKQPPSAGVPPTPEDQAKLAAVAQAGAVAAANEPDPDQASAAAKEAMKGERDRQQLPMSDAELDQIADKFVNLTIQRFEERGAFDPPPDPVAPAMPREAPPAPGQEDAALAAAAGPPDPAGDAAPAPQRTTFAQRFMGVR